MMDKLPSLNALRVFEIVATYKNITKAAQILGISQSAVSRHIKILEGDLGAPLFKREKHGLTITPQGIKLAGAAGEALDHIRSVYRSLSATHALNYLIKSPPTFTVRWLYPRFGDFKQANPGNNLYLHTRWEGITFDDETYDMGIRYGLGDWPRNYAKEIYAEWLVPVCSPDYLAKHQPLERPSDFSKVKLLHPTSDHADWHIWIKAWGKGGEASANADMDFNTQDLALNAAKFGFGITIADLALVDPEIQAGTLVPAIPAFLRSGLSYYFVFREKAMKHKDVRIFGQWLTGQGHDCMANLKRLYRLY